MMIHWHEGLHLLPQHLQTLQKFVQEQVGQERPFLHRYTSGILDLELYSERYNVGITRLRAIMPSGVMLIVVPTGQSIESAPLHQKSNTTVSAIDVQAELARRRSGFKLKLALPMWNDSGANTFLPGDVKAGQARVRYRLEETSLRDENVGGEGRPTYVRKFNARLLVESDSDDRSKTEGLETIDLARIEPAGKEGFPRVDEQFCPSLLRLRGWEPLYDLVRLKVNEMERTRGSLIGRIVEGGFDIQNLRGEQLSLLLKLRTANNHLSRLVSLLEVEHAAPFEVFCELQAMLGELAALDPMNVTLFQTAAFLHTAPYDQFRELLEKTIRLMEPAATTRYRAYEFSLQQPDAYYLAQVDPTVVNSKTEVYLCLESTNLRAEVDKLVQDRVRFILTSRDEVLKAYSGLKLSRCQAPRGLSAVGSSHYFRVQYPDSDGIWQTVVGEEGSGDGKLALRHPPTEVAIKSFTLYLS